MLKPLVIWKHRAIIIAFAGLALGTAACNGEDSTNDDVEDVGEQAHELSTGPLEPRMKAGVYHPSMHIFTNYWNGSQVTQAAQKAKQLAFGSPTSPTCYVGPAGKAQLAVQTEFIPEEYANNPNSLSLLDARLDALFAEGLAVHLLLPVHQVAGLPAGWGSVNWSAERTWANASTFVPVKPCPSEFVNGAKCPYDVLFDNFHKPVIQHLVATGRAQKLAMIYVMNEFGYDPGTIKDTSATWGYGSNWKLKRAEALAYTAARAVTKARSNAGGVVPVGIKFASVTSSTTGWAPDPTYNTDQLSYLLNDVMGPSGDVLGYDAYFWPNDPYDSGNKNRLSSFLSWFSNGRFEIAEFGRICQGSAGQFLNGTQRTIAGDITGAATYWNPAKGLNLFALNANVCYSLTDPGNINTVYSGAASEASGLWGLVKNATGSTSPSPCVQSTTTQGTCGAPLAIPSNGGTYTGSTSGSSAYSGTCGGTSAAEKVYSWTPAKSGWATISTCGSSLDTLLYMRSGSCTSGGQIQCVDDSCGLGSQISANVTAGTTYFIFVDGFSGTGSYQLSVSAPL